MRQHRQPEYSAQLEREKLESLKELAYGASHEINNPLANIAARAQSLLADERNPERRRKLTAIHRQAMRAHEMISDLMLYARPPKRSLVPCDVSRLVPQIIAQHQDAAAEREIELQYLASHVPIPHVLADETQIGVALGALIANAMEAIGATGSVKVSARAITIDGRTFVEIIVSDNGPGISPHVRRHMFDPFFSGREAGRGLGFGLSKCWRIVTDHGGDVLVHDSTTSGAEIAIRLPVAIVT
jgi:signal transduction histidine kinase